MYHNNQISSLKKVKTTQSTDIDEESPFCKKIKFSSKRSNIQNIKTIDLIFEEEKNIQQKSFKEIANRRMYNQPSNEIINKINEEKILDKEFSTNSELQKYKYKFGSQSFVESDFESKSTFSNLHFNNLTSESFQKQKQKLYNFCSENLESDIEKNDPNFLSESELTQLSGNANELDTLYSSFKQSTRKEKTFKEW